MLPIWTWPPQDSTFWDADWREIRATYPLTESNQIIRIPIVGPFNTLAIVRGFFPDQGIYNLRNWMDGNLHTQNFSVRTSLKLVGFTPGQDFRHSSTAGLRHYCQKPEMIFTVAVNKVDGHFGDDGRWLLDVETAFLAKHEFSLLRFDISGAAGHFHFSSFVLCNEAPVDLERNPGRLYTDPVEQPVWPDRP
jgi:hypothetical protein